MFYFDAQVFRKQRQLQKLLEEGRKGKSYTNLHWLLDRF